MSAVMATLTAPRPAATKEETKTAPSDHQNGPPATTSSKTLEKGCLSITVLGASGDLAKKKTFPALFALFGKGFLPEGATRIFGYARSKMTSDELRERLRKFLVGGKSDKDTDSAEKAAQFLRLVSYTAGPYDEDSGYQELEKEIADYEGTFSGEKRRLFYMALPPNVYPAAAKMIKNNCMAKEGWTRVVVEKPFGKDLESAEALSAELGELLTETQLYRIDHYLGKEVVQNLLVMRFANTFILPLWNRDHIDNVQITFKEPFGTEGRGGYFDQYGIIRDIIQNHLCQILCLVAMERPVSAKPEDVRDEKTKVLKSVLVPTLDEVVLGQYEGYKDDSTVPKDSNTPTFATLVLRIENERWEGVPFIMKAGKALDGRKAEVRIQFKDTPGDIFKCKKHGRNELVMRLQPSEAIYLKFTVKMPGLEMDTTQSELDLSYKERYQGTAIPEAYERLILDVIRGDQQHFLRRDELREAWRIFTPLLHAIDRGEKPCIPYKQGGRGPAESDELVRKFGYIPTEGYVWNPPK